MRAADAPISGRTMKTREAHPWSTRVVYALAVALLTLALTGCAARPVSPTPTDPNPLDMEDYVIGAADVLRISVWKNAELGVGVPVRPDGKISVPLVDDVQAAGLTPIELKEVLTQKLSEYIANPDVTVVVATINSKRVYMLGEISRKGPIALNSELRILDAISIAGGFTTFADKNNIRVLRRTAQGLVEYRFDYDAFIDGSEPEDNLVLRPGDTIVVPD